MKIAVLGCGSIGKRHVSNLRAIRPECLTAVYDPTMAIGTNYENWQAFMDAHLDADGVIIASPTECHKDQLLYVIEHGLNAYVEKPLTRIEDWEPALCEYLQRSARGLKISLGFQYRFGVEPAVILQGYHRRRMVFDACDALIGRYGPRVMEIMGSHAIDLALWALGPAESVDLETDGREFVGLIRHRDRAVSEYCMRIDSGPRSSTINQHPNNIDNLAYADALGAWLMWLETEIKDHRQATLADGAAVMDVMAQAKFITEKQA